MIPSILGTSFAIYSEIPTSVSMIRSIVPSCVVVGGAVPSRTWLGGSRLSVSVFVEIEDVLLPEGTLSAGVDEVWADASVSGFETDGPRVSSILARFAEGAESASSLRSRSRMRGEADMRVVAKRLWHPRFCMRKEIRFAVILS